MTSITHPPTLSQQPGTPAHEWAQDVVGAVDGAAETTRQETTAKGASSNITQGNLPGAASNVTTPGNELPGAFPRTTSTSGEPIKTLSESAQSALGSVKQQATPVAQSASQTAAGVLASAEQAARQYLPASVVGTLEGAGVLSGTNHNNHVAAKTSLPSQETGSEPTTSGGVGSLPGTASEVDVAKLPEERALERETGSAVGREGVHGTTADRSPTSDGHIGTTGADAKKLKETTGIPGAPSTAAVGTGGTALHHVQSPHSGTVHSSDAYASNTSPDSDAQAAERKEKPLPAPGGNTNKDVSERSDGNTAYALDQEKRQSARPSPNHAYTPPGAQAGLAAEHENQGAGTLGTQHERERASESSGSAHTGGSTGSPTSGKPSLSQKIKGEAKIIAGKIGKDAKKVEAGKAMKEGHVA